MKGLKIRVQSAPIYVDTMKAFGANVIAMSWSETPTALQQGVIDAVEPTPNAWVAAKIYELVDNITVTGYCFDFYIVGANKQWWQGFPGESTRACRRRSTRRPSGTGTTRRRSTTS